MNGQERRREIRELLESSAAKIRGSDLAKRFSVSRQVIVGDVALLKAEGGARGFYASGVYPEAGGGEALRIPGDPGVLP